MTDYDLHEVLRELARGAAAADYAAHLEAARLYREVEEQVGTEIAALVLRDWRLDQRTVRFESRAQIVKKSGLLQILLGRTSELEGQTLEVKDSYSRSDAAPALKDYVESEPVPGSAEADDGAGLATETQGLLLEIAGSHPKISRRTRELIAKHRLQQGQRWTRAWAGFMGRILDHLDFPQDLPSRPSASVVTFLRRARDNM